MFQYVLLVYRIDDQLLVKVADFGFSRDVYATQYYRLGHKTRLPVKWMPPESLLDNIYNEKSDIVSTNILDMIVMILTFRYDCDDCDRLSML